MNGESELGDIKAVVFDVDGTLSLQNSWARIAVGMGATHAEDLEILELTRNHLLTPEESNQKVFDLWTKKGLATKENFLSIFDSIPLRHDAFELVNYLRTKGLLICVITGSMDLYAKIIAKKIGADTYYSNAVLVWNNKNELVKFAYDFNQGAIKLKQFKDFLAKYKLSANECVAVGDSENDYLLFLETKRGIVLRSEFEDKILEAAAWKVVDSLSEIKKLI